MPIRDKGKTSILTHRCLAAILAGVRPKVGANARHASISTTPDGYSHLIPGMQEDAASRIDAALRADLDA